MKFGQVINAFRETYTRGRTQRDITSAALAFKRQLESVGLFPGLMAGTPPKLHKNVTTGPDGERITRGERKRSARALANKDIAEGITRMERLVETPLVSVTSFPPSRPPAGYNAGPHVFPDKPIIPTRVMVFDDSELAPRVVLHPDAVHQRASDVWAATHPAPAAEITAPRPDLSVTSASDGFWVQGKNEMYGPYKDRKTANRRMRQLGG